jgi:hypothetical protein
MGALAHLIVGATAHQGHAVAHGHFHGVGQTLADEQGVAVIGSQVAAQVTRWPIRLAAFRLGLDPRVATAKDPSRPLTMPPVTTRRVAASICGDAMASATMASLWALSRGSKGAPRIVRHSPRRGTWILPPMTLMALP